MSDTSALVLQRITIRRTPGIPDPYTLDTLCGGINVIHGPNGSGKSSTARAIQAALWPKAEEHRTLGLTAGYLLSGAEFVVHLDAGHVTVQQDGRDIRVPDLPAPELRERYVLSLHDLIQTAADGDCFAAHIAIESCGGLDLDAAARAIGCREKPSNAGEPSRVHIAAQATVRAAQSRQAALHSEGRRIAELEAGTATAAAAAARAQVLDKAIVAQYAATNRDAIRARLAEFPPAMSGVRGDEVDRLDSMAERAATNQSEKEDARGEVDRASRDARIALPFGPPAPGVLVTLGQHAATLPVLAQRRADAARQLRESEAHLRGTREAIGSAVTDDQLIALDDVSFGDLVKLARDADALFGEQAAVDALLRSATRPTPEPDMATVHRAVASLQGWLKEDSRRTSGDVSGAAAAPLLWLAILAAVAVGGWTWLGLVWEPVAFAGVVVAVAAAAAAAVVFRGSRRSAPEANGCTVQERAYPSGLLRPESWSVDAVLRRLDELYARLAEHHVAALEVVRVREAGQRADGLADRRASMDARVAELTTRLGMPGSCDPRQLSWLVQLVIQWRDARGAYIRAAAALSVATEQHAEACARVGEMLAPYGYPAPGTAADAAGWVAALDGRVRDHHGALERQAAALKRLESCQAAAADLERERSALFAALELGDGDEEGVRERCGLHDAWRDCVRDLGIAAAECTRAERELRSDIAFDDALLAPSLPALAAEMVTAQMLAQQHNALLVELTELRSLVNQGKTSREVEDALSALASAEDTLRVVQMRDLHAMIGQVLVQHAQRVTRDEHRPEVFHRSRELLARITRGRLRLEFSGDERGASPAFRAVDTVTGIGHSLDELSSGGRLQLLLAVRVAFVEAQEHGVKLPLLLDETLATSDDVRASAIIDAVIALAEGGRQVFYFTAQADEVVKWTAALAERSVTHRVIDLGARRGLGPTDVPSPLPPRAAGSSLTIPAGDGLTHESLGDVMRVPAIQAGRDHVGATHLWYVVEDVPALTSLMELRLTTWGELHTLWGHGGRAVLAERGAVYLRAAAFADALAAMHEAARVGHGRPVDRDAISWCTAVSAGKREEVVALAAQRGGDAADLMAALRQGGVPGLKRKKMDDLETFLRDEGHLVSNPPLSAEEIRVRMVAACAESLRAGTISPADLDRLYARIGARAAASVGGTGGVAGPGLGATGPVSRDTAGYLTV